MHWLHKFLKEKTDAKVLKFILHQKFSNTGSSIITLELGKVAAKDVAAKDIHTPVECSRRDSLGGGRN